MAGVIPFQVEAFPAGFEERVEAGVVIFFCGADFFQADQALCFVADGFPVVFKDLEIGEGAGRQVRRIGRYLGKHVHEDVERRHDRRMVEYLPEEGQARLAAKVHVQHR